MAEGQGHESMADIERRCIFSFSTVQAAPMRGVFEVLKDILHDVVIVISPAGCKLATMDGCKVTMIYMNLHAQNFESFKCRSTFEAGMNMTEIFKRVKQAGLRDIIQWYVLQEDPHKLYIAIIPRDTGIRNVFTYNLLDMNSAEVSLPDVSFSFLMTMPSAYFHRLVRAMQDIGDAVTITHARKRLTMVCEGLKGSQTVTVDDANLAAMDVDGDVDHFSASYPLKFLVSFAKAQILCTTVEMMMRHGYPLVLQYSIGCLGELKFCLANNFDDDEESSEDED